MPPRYGTVGAFLRVFCPRPGDGQFAERMTVRFSALAPINDPASLYKPIRKVIHRGHPEIRLTRGNHALVDSPFAPLRGWFPIECFHFPLRSVAQCAHKAQLQGEAFEKHIDRSPTAYHARHVRGARGAAGSASTTRRWSSPTTSSSAGVGEGRLVVDTRLARRASREPSQRERRRLRVPDPDARRGRRVRRRGGGARRGGRGPAAAAARRARAPAGNGRAAAAEPARVPEACTAPRSSTCSDRGALDVTAAAQTRSLHGSQADDHLVEAVVRGELLGTQVRRGEPVEEARRAQHVPVRARPRRSPRRTPPPRAASPSVRCSATTRRTPRPRAARSS